MGKPNTQFELSVEDLDMIETALHNSKQDLSDRLIDVSMADDDLKNALHSVHDLLGRLHNQKEFYRPKQGAYLGG